MIEKNRSTFIIGMLFILMSACEDIIDFPQVPIDKPVPVIESILTDRLEEQKVRVSYTVPINDSADCRIIENARVYVYSSENDTLFYKYSSDGWYISTPFASQTEVTYYLEVIIDSVIYKAEGRACIINNIDTVYYSIINDSTVNLYFEIEKRKPETNYYYAEFFRNDELLNEGKEIYIFYDENINEKLKLKIPYNFEKNDSVMLDFYSLSKNMFDYYYELVSEFYFTNYFNIGYKSNPIDMFNPKAMGYFQVSSIYSLRLKIK